LEQSTYGIGTSLISSSEVDNIKLAWFLQAEINKGKEQLAKATKIIPTCKKRERTREERTKG
jgi:hypothetical protein